MFAAIKSVALGRMIESNNAFNCIMGNIYNQKSSSLLSDPSFLIHPWHCVTTCDLLIRIIRVIARLSLEDFLQFPLSIALSHGCSEFFCGCVCRSLRSEEHTSELQSRPHISYAVFCLKKKKKKKKKKRKEKKTLQYI